MIEQDLIYCVDGGLVGDPQVIPASEPWEREWGAVGVHISCAMIGCGACGKPVVRGLTPSDEGVVYGCDCQTYTARGWVRLRLDPNAPTAWRCKGHPPIVASSLYRDRPVAIHDAEVGAFLAALVDDPPAPRSVHEATFPGFHLAHLLVHIPSSRLQRVLARRVVVANLKADDPRRRRAALDVYWLAPRFLGFEELAPAYRHARSARFDGPPPPGSPFGEGAWWRRVILAQLRGGFVEPLILALREDFALGIIDLAVVEYMVAIDPGWCIEAAPELARAFPAWESALREAFSQQPLAARRALDETLRARP